MVIGPYPATFLLKDLTGACIRGTYNLTIMTIPHLTQLAHRRNMAILVKVAFVILVIMRDSCMLVATIKELLCRALKCS